MIIYIWCICIDIRPHIMPTHLCPYPSLYPKFEILGELLRWVKRMRMPHIATLCPTMSRCQICQAHGRHLTAQCLSSLIAEAEQTELHQLEAGSRSSSISEPTDGTLTELRRLLPTSASFRFVCRWIVLICINMYWASSTNWPQMTTILIQFIQAHALLASPLLLFRSIQIQQSCRHGLVIMAGGSTFAAAWESFVLTVSSPCRPGCRTTRCTSEHWPQHAICKETSTLRMTSIPDM